MVTTGGGVSRDLANSMARPRLRLERAANSTPDTSPESSPVATRRPMVPIPMIPTFM